jgi:hypothetical protein
VIYEEPETLTDDEVRAVIMHELSGLLEEPDAESLLGMHLARCCWAARPRSG